jgi:hypothetical protein
MPGPSDLTAVLAVFAARMAGGYALCLGLLGETVRQGSWRKVSLFVVAGLSVVALAAGAPPWPAAALALAALLLERAIAFRVPRLGTSYAILPFAAWLLAAAGPFGLATVPSALAAGGTLAAMLLGHSYLTARGLGFGPLRRMAWLLFAVLVVRAGTVVPALFARLELMDWVFLSMRIALGLLLPLVLSWMVVQCARIGSNQSATGILYATTVLVAFFGELVAVYLALARGIHA